MTSVFDQIPENIWIEMIISNNSFEMYVPANKRSERIAQAYMWTKQRDKTRIGEEAPVSQENANQFKQILANLNKNGSSGEHNKWRSLAIKAIKNQ
jgi:hypothetical protein